MVGMARASFRTEGDDHRGFDRIDDRREPRSQLAEHLERCEAAVGKSENVKLSDAEPCGGAFRFLRARGGQLRSRGNVGEIANALGAVGRDHEMGFASLSRELGQEWADYALVVGVGEYGEDGPAVLSLRRERNEGGQRHGDEVMYGFSHANTL